MGKADLNYISAVAELLRGKQRHGIDALDERLKAKLNKQLKERAMNLAKSKQFANRGIGVLDDIVSPTVAPQALAGAGVGGLGGFLTAPGTENENLMGKKSYSGPSLGDRLSYGLSGALLGGGVGAGAGLAKINNLAKAVASGRKDLPPGMVNEFLSTLSAKQRNSLLNSSARAAGPDVTNQLLQNKAKQVVKSDWANPESAKLRAAELESKIYRVLKQSPSGGLRKTLDENVIDYILGRSLGTTKSVRDMSPAEITAAVNAVATSNRARFNAVDSMLSDTNVAGMQDAARRSLLKGGERSVGEAGKTVGSLGGVAGTYIGAGAGGGAGAIAGLMGGGALGKHLGQIAQGVYNKIRPGKSKYIQEEVAKGLDKYVLQGLKNKKNKNINLTFRDITDTAYGGKAPVRSVVDSVGELTNKGKSYRNKVLGAVAGAGTLGAAIGLGMGRGNEQAASGENIEPTASGENIEPTVAPAQSAAASKSTPPEPNLKGMQNLGDRALPLLRSLGPNARNQYFDASGRFIGQRR